MNALDNSEMNPVRVPDMERIRNARRKRQQQLKRWIQYDKNMEKKEKKVRSSTSPPPGSNLGGRQHPGFIRSVQFSQAVILLEAAARDDLDEGKLLVSCFINTLEALYIFQHLLLVLAMCHKNLFPLFRVIKSIRCDVSSFPFHYKYRHAYKRFHSF